MRTYLRNRTQGGLYFFTVNLAQRRGNRLLIDRIELLREAFRQTMVRHPFGLEAIVVLPEHLHCLWQMPEDDADYAMRWRLIKARFSAGIGRGERRSASRMRKGERGIWQRRYWDLISPIPQPVFPSPSGRRWREAPDEGLLVFALHEEQQDQKHPHPPAGTFSRREKGCFTDSVRLWLRHGVNQVLGTPHPGRGGLRTASGLHPLQPGQAWPRGASE